MNSERPAAPQLARQRSSEGEGLSYDRLFRMKTEAVAYGIAGIIFGLIAGWIIGSQYESARRQPMSAATTAAPAAPQAQAPPPLDEAKVTAFRSAAER